MMASDLALLKYAALQSLEIFPLRPGSVLAHIEGRIGGLPRMAR